MGRGKKRPLVTKATAARGHKLATLHELRSHRLLQRCGFDSQPVYGEFVWAKASGSSYWPAIVSRATPEDHEEKTDMDEPTQFAFVMYTEPKFRLSLMSWSRIIPVDMKNIEEQIHLIVKLNDLEAKKKSYSRLKTFRDSCEIMKSFESVLPAERQALAVKECAKYAKQPITKVAKEKKPYPKMPILPVEGRSESCISSESTLGKTDPAPRLSNAYQFRPTIKAAKIWDNSMIKQDPKATSVENSDTASNTSSTVSKKKPERPKEGDALRKWTAEKFESIDKQFRFDSQDNICCSRCQEKITDSTQIEECHELSFHRGCLVQVPADDKDTFKVEKSMFKCEDCLGARCAVCHKENMEGAEVPTKCSKCELRFHRDCLVYTWPQAEVVGTSGSITCPLHYCHSCKAEHLLFAKVRNFKLTATRAIRCVFCFASYHRGTCIPAGTGDSIMQGQFIICPRHYGKESQARQKKVKKLGCFSCQKKILSKEDTISCNMCPLFFHKDCVYTDEQINSGISVEKYQEDFKCEGCVWGIYPLYGQVIWFQQPGSTYWPSIVMYPKDSAASTSTVSTVGAFGVSYCGFGNWLSYPNGLPYQSIPLEMASKDFLKKLNLYSNEKVESAAKEAFHLLKLSDLHRDKMLPPPEPVYKKIDKNVLRIKASELRDKNKNKGRTSSKLKSIAADKEDTCPCGTTDKTGDVCTANSSCFNRATHSECTDDICSGGDRCRNRMFSTKTDQMEHMLEYFVSSTSKGWGVKTKAKLKEGTFIIEYVGEVIAKEEVYWRVNRKVDDDPLYFLEIDVSTYIDAEYLGNMSRLINHSCSPNCKTEKYSSAFGKPVVGIFALRDIEVGEELTFDYNYGTATKFRFKCRCKSANCKGFIGRYDGNEENLIPGEKLKKSNTNDADWKWEDECSSCGARGELLMCDFSGCSKSYHMHCLGIVTTPKGVWTCPRHNEDYEEVDPEEAPEPPLKKAKLSKKVRKSTSRLNTPPVLVPEVESEPIELASDPSEPTQSDASPVMSNGNGVTTPRAKRNVKRKRETESAEPARIIAKERVRRRSSSVPPTMDKAEAEAGEVELADVPHVKSSTRNRPFRLRNVVTASLV